MNKMDSVLDKARDYYTGTKLLGPSTAITTKMFTAIKLKQELAQMEWLKSSCVSSSSTECELQCCQIL